MNLFDQIDAELQKISALATAGYFLGLRIRGSVPLLAFHTYPQAWIDEYTEGGYVLRDPVTAWAMTVGGSIRWDSPRLPDPFGIFRKARAHGLRHGVSIAHGPISSLTICSAARSDRAFSDEEIDAIRDIVVALHDRVALPQALTGAQKAILEALAEGAPIAEVAARLGSSRAAAERAVRELCVSLVARTPGEAVERARNHRLI